MELVLQDELHIRDQRQITRRNRNAAFRETRSLDQFDFSFNPSINRARILIGVSFLLIFTWSFIPASLVFCNAVVDLYETAPGLAVRYVLGYGLLTGMDEQQRQ